MYFGLERRLTALHVQRGRVREDSEIEQAMAVQFKLLALEWGIHPKIHV